jgi:hypothetical protein
MTTWGSAGTNISTILDVGTRLRGVINFTTWSLYPRRKSPSNPLDRRLVGLIANLYAE